MFWSAGILTSIQGCRWPVREQEALESPQVKRDERKGKGFPALEQQWLGSMATKTKIPTMVGENEKKKMEDTAVARKLVENWTLSLSRSNFSDSSALTIPMGIIQQFPENGDQIGRGKGEDGRWWCVVVNEHGGTRGTSDQNWSASVRHFDANVAPPFSWFAASRSTAAEFENRSVSILYMVSDFFIGITIITSFLLLNF